MDGIPAVRPYSFMPELPLAERWQRLKPIISGLYIDENRKLDDVTEVLRMQYGFDASKHQVKYHIRQWKLQKSIPTKAKKKMYRMIEERAALGKSTLLEYKGKSVDGRKLVRHAVDQSNKSIVRHSLANLGADSNKRREETGIRMAEKIFTKWNLPYFALRNSQSGATSHNSPLPVGPSPASDIVAITPTATGVLSPSPDSPSRVLKAAWNKTALERAHLFVAGKHHDLVRTMDRQETLVMSTWLYQFWIFAFRTARYWGKGPRHWTKDLMDLDKHMEKLSVSGAPTPDAIAPNPSMVATPTATSSSLVDRVSPSILCNWSVHVPEIYFEPIHSTWSDDLESHSESPYRNWKGWPRSWNKPDFVQRLHNGLRRNVFSNLAEENLPVAVPRLLQNTNVRRDALLDESLGFSIMGRNVFALESVVKKFRRYKKKVENLYPFHLATSYLSGSDPCCNLFSFMLSRPSIFPLKELYVDDKGHSILDNLIVAIVKSHTRCPPASLDENMRHTGRFDGEEVDICGRWDAGSDEILALLAKGIPRIPFEWKHKFCHTSVQVICHCISLLFSTTRRPDINLHSGLFRKKCQHCSHELRLLPLHATVMTAVMLAEQGSNDEDLFGIVACLLCLLKKGADPTLAAELSVGALFGDSAMATCSHESLDVVQLAERVSEQRMNFWNPIARTGWTLFCYVLKTAKNLKQPSPVDHDVILTDIPQTIDYFHPLSSAAAWDENNFPGPWEQPETVIDSEDDGMSVDEEVSWCHSCCRTNHFKGSTELRDLWAAVQAEILTYRRLCDWHNWLSANFNMDNIVANIEAGNGIQIGFLQRDLLRNFCDCGDFGEADLPDIACVDEVCSEYFSNLEEWERTTYLWCPEVIEGEEDEFYDGFDEEDYDDDEDDDEDEDDEDDDEDDD